MNRKRRTDRKVNRGEREREKIKYQLTNCKCWWTKHKIMKKIEKINQVKFFEMLWLFFSCFFCIFLLILMIPENHEVNFTLKIPFLLLCDFFYHYFFCLNFILFFVCLKISNFTLTKKQIIQRLQRLLEINIVREGEGERERERERETKWEKEI